MRKLSHCFLLLLLVLACASRNDVAGAFGEAGLTDDIIFGESDLSSELVPLVALLVDPQRFGDRPVRVEGVLNLSFDGPVLCLDQESARNLVYSNCLWLDFEPEDLVGLGVSSTEQLSQWTGFYALLDGTVSAMRGAELNWNTVSLSRVTSMIIRGNTVICCGAWKNDGL